MTIGESSESKAAGAQGPVLGPDEGRYVQIRNLGVRFMIDSERTDGAFSLVEHPLAPRGLGSPVHTHSREDEYSYVIEGQVGIELGDRTLVAGTGDLVFKPRGVPHAFWNASDTQARLLEIISPAGFEKYFDELAELLSRGDPPDPDAASALWDKYGLQMDVASVPRLMEQHGLAAPQK